MVSSGVLRQVKLIVAFVLAVIMVASGSLDLRAELGPNATAGVHHGLCAPKECSPENGVIPGSAHHHCAPIVIEQSRDGAISFAYRSVAWPELVISLRGLALPPDPPPPRAAHVNRTLT
jgi:hypothetical protein